MVTAGIPVLFQASVEHANCHCRSGSLCLMGWFAEEVGSFQECAHGGGQLSGGGQDDAE